MKTIFTISFLVIVFIASAQNFSVEVYESIEKIGHGNNNALVVTIYENSLAVVEKEWKDRMKDFDPEKNKLSHDELSVDNATIKEMGNNTIDIYCKFIEDVRLKNIKMIAAFDLGGAFLTSSTHKDKFEIAKKIMVDFATKLTKEAIEKQIKDELKTLGRLEEKEKDLEKDKKNLENEIKSQNEKIKKAEVGIIENEKNQQQKKKEIDDEKKIIELIKKKQVTSK